MGSACGRYGCSFVCHELVGTSNASDSRLTSHGDQTRSSARSTETDGAPTTIALAFKSLRCPHNGLPAPACDHPNSEWSFLCHYITDIRCKNKSNRLQCLDTWKKCGMGDSPAHAASLCPLRTNGLTSENANA